MGKYENVTARDRNYTSINIYISYLVIIAIIEGDEHRAVVAVCNAPSTV